MSGFVINVGHHQPEEVVISKPTAEGRPMEDAIRIQKTIGAYFLINRARVWARRVMPDGKPAKNGSGVEEVLEAQDTRYKGTLEFMDWGTNKTGAQAIEIRYLPQSLSLDYDYQKNIQKIEASGEDGGNQVQLGSGENKFDFNKEALFIQYLKVHPSNRDSKCKNPDPKIKGFIYYELTDEMVDRESIKQSEARIESGYFVKGLSAKPGSLRNLFDIFRSMGIDFGEINNLSNESDVYKALLKFAESAPAEFEHWITEYKKDLQDKFDWAKSHNALDLTKNGNIVIIVDNKKELIWDNAEGKGDQMIEWVITNYCDSSVYEKTRQFKSLCEKLK